MMPDRKRGLSSSSLKLNFPLFPARFEHGQMTKAAIGVTCCRCGSVERMTINNKPAEDGWITKSFQRKGWNIGRDRSHDTCPTCRTTTRKEPELMAKPMLVAVAEPPMSQPEKPVAQPPREMAIDDRRIIFEKLNEVYLDKNVGYSNGWTDLRVAQDIYVPTSWVAKVREEFFGPVKVNEEAIELHRRVGEMMEELGKLNTSIERAEALLKELRTRQSEALTKMEPISKLAKAIEKQF